MLQKKFVLSLDKISTETSHYSIGFAHLREANKVETAYSAGSGTLVTVGSLFGILTAAHVLDRLPNKGNVGLVTHADNASQFQKQVIAMEQTDREIVGQAPFSGHIGPDLAFLRLPAENIGWLKAKQSFYNLTRRRDDVLTGKEPSRTSCDCVVGIIHEMTKPLPREKPNVQHIQFSAIFCPVRLSALRYPSEFELNYFVTANEQDFPLPKSFQGTSGGAVWRFYLEEKSGTVEVVDCRLIGVPFYESLDAQGKRELTCQGPKGLYGGLIDRITKRWPDAKG